MFRVASSSNIHRSKEQLEIDFWKRVEIRGFEECWPWIAATNGKTPITSYGTVWMNGKKWKAHRFSFTVARGEIPNGLMVCHHCDNPKCCNPTHLFLGTSKDNSHDSWRKGRMYREYGTDRYNAVLDDQKIVEIRSSYVKRKKGGLRALGEKYGVGPTMIHAIIKGRRWKHVTQGFPGRTGG